MADMNRFGGEKYGLTAVVFSLMALGGCAALQSQPTGCIGTGSAAAAGASGHTPDPVASHRFQCGKMTVSYQRDGERRDIFRFQLPELRFNYLAKGRRPEIATEIYVPELLPDGTPTGSWQQSALQYPFIVRPQPQADSDCRHHCRASFSPEMVLPAELLIKAYAGGWPQLAGFRIGPYTARDSSLLWGRHYHRHYYYLPHTDYAMVNYPAGDKTQSLRLRDGDLRLLLCSVGLMPAKYRGDCQLLEIW